MARSEDRELEPLDPLDPMLAAPEAFAPLRDEEPAEPEARVDDPAPSPRRRAVRRRLVAALVVVAVLAGAVLLAQNLLDARAARHAAAMFTRFQVNDYLLSQQTTAVDQRMVPDDRPKVDLVLARAERDEIAQDTRALNGLTTPFWLDSSTRQVVQSVRQALAARIADLRTLVAWRAKPVQTRGPQPPDPSLASKALLDRAMALAAPQIGRLPTPPSAARTGDVLASLHLSNYSDAPTGSTLAVANAGGVALVNVDASSSVNLNVAPTAQTLVGRNGYVAAITRDGLVLAKPPVADAPLTWLGPAQELLPAAQPYAVWLVQSERLRRFAAATTYVTEVDGTAQKIIGPVAIPAGQYITGGVTETGLVLAGGGQGLAVWDARTRAEHTVAPPGATLLAAAPGMVAWQGDTESVVHVTDTRSGADRSVVLPADNSVVADLDVSSTTCTFSPDESQLACPVLDLRSIPKHPTSFAPFRLGIIDLDEGNIRVLPGAASTADAHPIVWSHDGTRVWSVVATDEGSLLATWGAGEPNAREVRYRVGQWLVGVAVLEQRPTSSS